MHTGDPGWPTFHPFRWRSNSLPPAILHTCQESRVSALKVYRLEFGFEQIFKHFTHSTQPKIYINMDVDRVCIMQCPRLPDSGCGYPELLQTCAANGTRRLALHVDEYSGGYYKDVKSWLSFRMEEIMFFASTGRLDRICPVGSFSSEADINSQTFKPTNYGVQNRALKRSNILPALKRCQQAEHLGLVVKLGYHMQRPAAT